MASIKCGNCKDTHSSANQVRECYATKGGNTKVGFKSTARRDNARDEAIKNTLRSTYETKGTPRQSTTQWAKANMDTDWKAEHAAREAQEEAAAYVAKMERDLELAKIQRAPVAVPKGRYAIHADGKVKFYKVDRPENGKWKGYVFVSVQASDETYSVRNKEARERILAEIGKDVAGAMALYGMELGKCGHCNRTLTSEWRKKGIGPVCAKNMGFVG